MFLLRDVPDFSVNQKSVNRTLLLNAILRLQPISQTQLSSELNLSKSTVSRLVSELLSSGVLREMGTSKSNKNGRNPLLIGLNPDYRRSLVVKIGVNYSILAIAEFSMELKYAEMFRTPESPESFIDYVVNFCRRNDNCNIDSVSVSIPGIVDKDFRHIIVTPNLGWRDLPFSEMLGSGVSGVVEKKIDVLLDNEANFAVIAEVVFGNRVQEGDKNIVYILFGEGIGTGLVINGQLYRGQWNTAGEFGHMIVKMSGRRCHCGNRGCWERYASIGQVSDRDYLLPDSDKPVKQVDNQRLKEYAEVVAIGIANIVNGLGPDLVIVGGTISAVWDRISGDVVRRVKEMSITDDAARVRVVPSSFSKYPAELYGAALWSFWDVFEGPVLV